jgi:hypothetical protein
MIGTKKAGKVEVETTGLIVWILFWMSDITKSCAVKYGCLVISSFLAHWHVTDGTGYLLFILFRPNFRTCCFTARGNMKVRTCS